MAMDTAKLMGLMKQKKAALTQKSKTLKPQPGANQYILLPGWRKGEEHVYFHEFGQHFIKNAAGEIQAVYPCLDATYGRACPICEGVSMGIRMAADDDVVKQLEEAACGVKKQTYLLNVLALGSADPKTPQILEVKKSAFGQIVAIVEEWAEGVFDESNPQIIILNRDGTGLNTKYTVQVSSKRSPMPADALTKLVNLDEYVLQENEENQRRALNAINNVAGLLPSGADTPKTASDEADGIPVRSMERTERKAPVPKPPVITDDLDDLLAELDGTND